MSAESMINSNQIKLIHIAKNQLGISDAEYRGMLRQGFEVATSKDLTFKQADTLIKEFAKRGFKRTGAPRPRYYGKKRPRGYNLIDLPSPQIMKKIEQLAKDIRWNVHDGYDRWVMARFHVSRPRHMHEAQMIVEGLKAMRARQQIERIESTPAHSEAF